jgi:hypothetical protein
VVEPRRRAGDTPGAPQSQSGGHRTGSDRVGHARDVGEDSLRASLGCLRSSPGCRETVIRY